MALSIPREGLKDLGDRDRWQMACRAFILFMREHDPRVRAAWDRWLGARQIPMWAQRRWTEAPVSEATIDGLMAAILSDPEALDDELRRLVHDEIGIPYLWVPPVLRKSFQVWTAKKLQLPIPPGDLVMTIPLPDDFPIGKGPTAGGRDIIRNVWWLYQVRFWPPERRRSIKGLAKAWDQEHPVSLEHEDSRKLIRGGMKQADALLDLARW